MRLMVARASAPSTSKPSESGRLLGLSRVSLVKELCVLNLQSKALDLLGSSKALGTVERKYAEVRGHLFEVMLCFDEISFVKCALNV
jgi:hypothetical protein